ncbi:Similar to phosphoglycolate phosphatase, clustered with ubiquinone biosynthesis SAM-dependent O-methyltransferase [hydrothermal vent metagenome]|uniref:Similar to phosphoglycolate phosphatase, clustered with ubiquinone biosynthesis SAM-dependent O-methyltransferase n=1 Tax=hydrothermal vent metagenome TaxID=652676 RepID=A0A3B0ZY58_9ZZZZ
MAAQSIQTVLFDLDGTFADTAPDLAHALNQTLAAHQQPELGLEQIRPVVSHGGKALIELGFKLPDADPKFEPLRLELLEFYKLDIAKHTILFDGINLLIEQLPSLGISWGIVTNKPSWLTDPLMQALGISERACSIVSGDTLAQRKPDPEPLLLAATQCNTAPESCLYIGDAERDIVAGKRANMRTMVALYGYIESHSQPHDWQADIYINHASEILDWILKINNTPVTSTQHAN